MIIGSSAGSGLRGGAGRVCSGLRTGSVRLAGGSFLGAGCSARTGAGSRTAGCCGAGSSRRTVGSRGSVREGGADGVRPDGAGSRSRTVGACGCGSALRSGARAGSGPRVRSDGEESRSRAVGAGAGSWRRSGAGRLGLWDGEESRSRLPERSGAADGAEPRSGSRAGRSCRHWPVTGTAAIRPTRTGKVIRSANLRI